MEEEFNNHNIERIDENSQNNSPNKRTKFISTRKRKEYIDTDSDREDNLPKNKNIAAQKISKEESKELETGYSKNNKSNYFGNKYNTKERNKSGGSPLKDNLTLQEKLKKIFINRDKVNFQYPNQEIPESLKYNSDDSESDDLTGLRKSINSKNSNKKEINDTKGRKKSSFNNRNSNETKKVEQDGGLTFSPPLPAAFEGEEKIKKNEERRKFISYNEEEKTKSNEKNSSNKFEGGNYKYNNKWNNKEAKEKQDDENNDFNQKENSKKDKLLKMFQKMDKKDKNDDEIEDSNNSRNNIRNKYSSKKEIKKKEENDKKQKLLKLLFHKKDSNTIDNANNDNDENNDIDDFEEESPKNKIDIEKENRRRKIIEQLKLESSNSPSKKRSSKYPEKSSEKKEEKTEVKENKKRGFFNDIKKEKKEEDENKEDDDNDNDKGTYLPNNQKNRLTISIKPKSNLVKQISKASIEEKNNDKNDIDDEKEEKEEKTKKDNKANSVHDILEKLKKKKSEEKILTEKEKEAFIENDIDNDNRDDIINESEIEREAEKIRKKEKKMEERRLAREKQKNIAKNEKTEKEEENDDDNNYYLNNNNSNNKNTNYSSRRKKYLNYKESIPVDNKRRKSKEIEYNKNELKQRKQFEEDLKAELNDYNKDDDDSTVINSSKSNILNLKNINNSNMNIQINQSETDDRSMKKDFNTKEFQSRKPSIYKNIVDEGAAPNEIVINDMPTSNLDRSFDTYTKRKIPSGKNALNIYRPKKADMRGRSQERNFNEMIKNNSSSFNPGKNVNFPLENSPVISYNPPNKLTYFKKKSSMNDINGFLANNRSFCEHQKESLNQFEDRNNINMEIELGAGLNSSFDAYMQNNMNNYNNSSHNNLIMNMPNKPTYSTSNKKFGNGRYNQVSHAPVSNINYNKNYSNNFYKNNNMNDNNNNNINRSYGYINTNNFNESNSNSIYNNNNNPNNSRYNNNSNYNTKTNNANKNNQSFYGLQKKQFVTYNNRTSNYYNSPLKTYESQSFSKLQPENFNKSNKSFYPNSPIPVQTNIPKYPSSKTKGSTSNLNTDINTENYINNCTPYPPKEEKNTSINIEDLMVLEEKLNEIILAINKNGTIHNECFEFWNYYYNCSFYGKLEKLFKTESDKNNVQISINHILISVMICYDYSYELEALNHETSILVEILSLNHSNLIIIYEHILSKISAESKSNAWVYKLSHLVKNYNNRNDKDNSQYISMNGRKLSPVEKIKYNVGIITQNIRVLLKNYKTRNIEHLTSIFKKINEKTYEEINTFFRDNILRAGNANGSVLASVFLKDNEYFQTEPAPYIKTKNRKPFSLILDLDETLVHFKINSDDDTEGTLQIRPGIMPFLEEVGKYYELIVFTAATQDYGDLLIDAIEENNVFFEHRFYRQHTVIIGNDFVKDLNRIGRPIDKIIIVDNMPQNFRLQKENGINIKAFWGEDANDNALEELGKILINIAKDGGDVRIGLEKYRDEIVKKVTSNISKSNY